ncbi:Ras GTPase activation domain-containing protein [Heterostelium album PN500]|uniref:Ras GTPase activation domain-containing protein n=1 Tax=Heterostelium pallidum (strain ATCC 26659 / Pp 5 / PN500) TaxID=670386 RepID=D3BAM0_HETP5|nr:Ras GTPase activation domain-containing protein [Heterostelium album PN500]EFA81607.1 Ras GTPase activation domain-containing protein [Heterostelium album PN500]|eukprot:XP_020433724.1 Ras GTPase activation domain-containing protein [Heterostelium album PN500]
MSSTNEGQSGQTQQVFGSKYKHNFRSQYSTDKVDKKYNDIIELLLSPQFEIVNVLCSITLVKETSRENTVNISETLVNFFEIHSSLKSSYLLKWAIDKEIECTSNGATLFRGLSTATRLISSFYKKVGDSYLKYLLQPFVLDLCSRNFSFEIDPEKAGKGMDVKSNLERLITITQQLLDKILDSSTFCPVSIRNILRHTQERVEKKFPEMKTTVIGGFMFLRYICPAIVAPEVFGLIQDIPTTDSRRGLVLVSKLLQNLANEMPFGGIKEEYMTYLNRFIAENSSRIHVFFNELAYDTNPLHQSSINTSSNNFSISSNNGSNTSSNNLGSANGLNQSTASISTKDQSNRIRSRSESPPLKPIGSTQKLINTNTQDISFTDDQIQENLATLIGQLFEHKERLETIITESLPNGSDLVKKIDSALAHVAKLHQKSIQSMQAKISSMKKQSSTANGSSSTTPAKKKQSSFNNSQSTGNLSGFTRDPSHTNLLLFQSETEEELNSQMHRSISEVVNFYRHQLDLKDLELKANQDELAMVKKELEDSKSRSGTLKKLKEEFDIERRKRKEAEHQLKKCIEKLKSSGFEPDTVMLSRDEEFSEISNDDVSESASSVLNQNARKKKSGSSTNLNNYVRKSESSTSLVSMASSVGPSSPQPTSTTPHHNVDTMSTSSIAQDILESTGINGANQKQSSGSSNKPQTLTSHSRSNSASELTSSESQFDHLETEDRIIQACVDGEISEDDEGLDLLEFLREYGEKAQASNSAIQKLQLEDNSTEKKKRGSGIFKHMPSLKMGKKKSNSKHNTLNSNSNNNSSSTSSNSASSSPSNSSPVVAPSNSKEITDKI